MIRLRSPLRLFVAASAILVVVFASNSDGSSVASASASQKTSLRVGVTIRVSVLDPGRESLAFTNWVTSLGVEKLMKFDADGVPKPNLAASVKRPNAFTYIFTLRKGITFWDGNPLTAEDVENALNYYRSPQLVTSANFSSVRNVKATGRYTVQITLKRRDAGFLASLALYGHVFEKKFGDAHPGTMGRPGVLTMGTGPWKFDSLSTTGVELSANGNYWGGKVPLQHISIQFISDEATEALAFRNGDIDLALNILDARQFTQSSGSTPVAVPTCGVFFLGMNTKRAPWSDIHVRRAVAYAINRAGFIQASGGPGAGSPVYTLISPPLLRALGPKTAVTRLLNSLPKYKYSLAKAKQELSKSSYPDGFSTTLRVFPTIAARGQAIAGMLAQIGIKMDVKNVPVGEWLGIASGPKDTIESHMTGAACVPDASYWARNFVYGKSVAQGKFNFANYTNRTADALIDAGSRENNRAKRLTDYGNLLKILARDVPYVPLYASNFNYALSKSFTWLKGSNYVGLYGAWALGIRPK